MNEGSWRAKPKSASFSFRLIPWHLEKAKRECARKGLTLSEYLRRAIEVLVGAGTDDWLVR
jgi:hypothetical protein